MANKKKPSGGKHKTPRKPVQLPLDWLLVAKRLASKRMTTVGWLIVELLRREAETAGEKDLPVLPWLAEEPKK